MSINYKLTNVKYFICSGISLMMEYATVKTTGVGTQRSNDKTLSINCSILNT